VKYENPYLNDYGTPRAARQGLAQYLEFYNEERPHQALGYRTPAEVYPDPSPVSFVDQLRQETSLDLPTAL